MVSVSFSSDEERVEKQAAQPTFSQAFNQLLDLALKQPNNKLTNNKNNENGGNRWYKGLGAAIADKTSPDDRLRPGECILSGKYVFLSSEKARADGQF